jgi:type VI secretion system protein ImpA
MSSPDYSSLLMMFEGDRPGGEPLDYNIKARLDEDRKSIDPNDYDEDDPQRPTEPKYADWEDIIEVCFETLTTKTKDLNLVVRLIEAMTRLNGYGGLLNGLDFLKAYLENCWEFTYPLVESEEDLELRAGPFNWLSDPHRGSRFPTNLLLVPVIDTVNEDYNVLDWKNSNNPKAEITQEMLNKAIDQMDLTKADENFRSLVQSLELLSQIQTLINELMGPYAPSLTSIIQSVIECKNIAEGIFKRLQSKNAALTDMVADSDDSMELSEQSSEASSVASATWSPQNARQTREAIYTKLTDLSNTLIELEPHSPIPYLIRKAVDLGSLPYPQLMARILENSEALEAIRREFGLPMDENEM